MEFEVTNDVLVPRPETELLVQEALKGITNYELRITNKYSKNSKLNHKSELINHKSGPKVLDIGTGSGTIAIALAEEFPEIDIQAVDISKEALVVAKKNAKRNGVTNIRFTQADLFTPVAKNEPLKTKFDIITANLPYIPSEDMEGLAIDVYHYEPKLALDGGLGGLEIYKRMLSQVGKYLKPGGQIFCEIGVDQGKEFKILVKKYLPNSSVQILGDLAGIDRIAIIKTNNN